MPGEVQVVDPGEEGVWQVEELPECQGKSRYLILVKKRCGR